MHSFNAPSHYFGQYYLPMYADVCHSDDAPSRPPARPHGKGPNGETCNDCGGPLCPCSWKPGPGPPPPPPQPHAPLIPACTAPHDRYPFCNTSLPVEDRITNLMTFIDDAVKPNLLTARGGPHGLQNLSHVGVPAYYWGTNCLHSVGAPCTFDGHCPTNFPSGPSMAASFDREMIAEVATVVGRELRALYNVGSAKGQ